MSPLAKGELFLFFSSLLQNVHISASSQFLAIISIPDICGKLNIFSALLPTLERWNRIRQTGAQLDSGPGLFPRHLPGRWNVLVSPLEPLGSAAGSGWARPRVGLLKPLSQAPSHVPGLFSSRSVHPHSLGNSPIPSSASGHVSEGTLTLLGEDKGLSLEALHFTQPSGSGLKATCNLVFRISARKLFQTLFCGLWLNFPIQFSPWLVLSTPPSLLFTLLDSETPELACTSANRGHPFPVLCPVLGSPVPKRFGQTGERPQRCCSGCNISYMRKHREVEFSLEERRLSRILSA